MAGIIEFILVLSQNLMLPADYLWTASDSLGSLVRYHAVAGVQYDDDDSMS